MRKEQVVVKTYKNPKAYKRDAGRMARKGYRVVSVLRTPESGCFWILVRRRVTVTYQLEG